DGDRGVGGADEPRRRADRAAAEVGGARHRDAAAPRVLALPLRRRGPAAADPAGAGQAHLARGLDQHLLRPPRPGRGPGGRRPPPGRRGAGPGRRPARVRAAGLRLHRHRRQRRGGERDLPRLPGADAASGQRPGGEQSGGHGLEVGGVGRRGACGGGHPVRLQPLVGAPGRAPGGDRM
ncbi:MAG: Isopentenyl-diphosphate Delta-isomerase, partial [uncultured Friedmanniella sp.]